MPRQVAYDQEWSGEFHHDAVLDAICMQRNLLRELAVEEECVKTLSCPDRKIEILVKVRVGVSFGLGRGARSVDACSLPGDRRTALSGGGRGLLSSVGGA